MCALFVLRGCELCVIVTALKLGLFLSGLAEERTDGSKELSVVEIKSPSVREPCFSFSHCL